MQLAIAIAADDDGLAADGDGDEIIVVGDFAFVTSVNPHFFKNQFHLQLKQLGLGEHVTRDAVNAVLRAKIQTVFDEALPLFCVLYGHCSLPSP